MNVEDDVFGVFFFEDFSVGSDGKERLQCGRAWTRKWQPTPAFLPGESHGQRGLAGHSRGITKSQTLVRDY